MRVPGSDQSVSKKLKKKKALKPARCVTLGSLALEVRLWQLENYGCSYTMSDRFAVRELQVAL